jgi:hypothetical protein
VKVYLIAEMQNTGGVPPDKDRLGEELCRAIVGMHLEPQQLGEQYSENDVIRARVLEVEP